MSHDTFSLIILSCVGGTAVICWLIALWSGSYAVANRRAHDVWNAHEVTTVVVALVTGVFFTLVFFLMLRTYLNPSLLVHP